MALGIVLLPYLKNGNECISVLHVGARSLNFTKQKQTKLFFYRLSKNKYIALKAVPDTQQVFSHVCTTRPLCLSELLFSGQH